jgi:hypothetical protein
MEIEKLNRKQLSTLYYEYVAYGENECNGFPEMTVQEFCKKKSSFADKKHKKRMT